MSLRISIDPLLETPTFLVNGHALKLLTRLLCFCPWYLKTSSFSSRTLRLMIMQKKREICEYRDKLDKTLSSPELTNQETLKSLLKNQLCSSSQECNEVVLEKRTDDIWKLLCKLRSVSMKESSKLANDASSWKLKQDHEDCRVMYREGLDGSPFYTLLVEGFVDGPIQDCLCVTWEAPLYHKWFPQYAFPPFGVLKSTCLLKVGIGEQISLTRMKVPWPLTDREMIVHYFCFEYLKDGLVIILLNTVSDIDSIGYSSKDFTKNVIPESSDAVRMDIVGGLVLQKVTQQRSYFRAIGDMDIKLDFVPPSLINFISRQVIGSGFRLYKKSVASIAKSDEDYCKALADPLYMKLRQALYSTDKAIKEEPKLEAIEVSVDSSENEHVHCKRTVPEIEEEEVDSVDSNSSEDGNEITKSHVNTRRRFCISPEVEQALGTLDRVIYMVRNPTPVQETEEVSPNRAAEDQAKQVRLLENVASVVSQRSHRQDSTVIQETSGFREEEKRENEAGSKDGSLNKGKKNSSLRRKRKPRLLCF